MNINDLYDDINRGVHEFDALDYAYMYIKNHYASENVVRYRLS